MRFLWLGFVIACSSSDVPPPQPDADATTSTTVSTFAVDTLLLGESSSLDGPESLTAWKRFGYDLDGVSTNDCTPHVEGVEGDDGIDNAFGAKFLTSKLDPTPSVTTTNLVQSGFTTLVFAVTGLTGGSNQTATGLDVTIASGAQVTAPSFTSAMTWPTINGSSAHFSEVYVTDGLVVARSPDMTVNMTVFFQGGGPFGSLLPVRLRIHSALITFRPGPTGVDDGTIAGTLDTTELIDSIQTVVGGMSQSLCGSAFDGIRQQMLEMQDILVDGTNKAGVPCNAISIGLKFTAKQIANGSSTVDASSPPDPCADAGTD